MQSSTTSRHTGAFAGFLLALFALGLTTCTPNGPVPREAAAPSATTTRSAGTPSAVPPSATATASPNPLPSPTATAATTATPTSGSGGSASGGSTGRPTAGLRLLATWGEGVPAAVALSSDGGALFVATALRLQRRDAGDLATIAWELALETPPVALALSPDGATLALAAGEKVELRATTDGAIIQQLRLGAAVADLAFSPDGALLAAAVASDSVELWNLAAVEPIRELRPAMDDTFGMPAAFTSVAFAPDGERIAAGDLNGNVLIWSVADGDQRQSLSVGPRVVADVAFAPDGASLAAASEGWRSEAGAIWIWDALSGVDLARLSIDGETRLLDPVLRVAFAADASAVIAGTAAGELLRWSWPEGKLEREIQAHGAAVSALVLTPGGGAITAGRDGALRRWNGNGARIDEVKGLPAISAVAAGEGLILTGGEDGSLARWGSSGRQLDVVPAHSGPINALATSPNGALLASGGDDGKVRLWALPDCAPRARLVGHDGPVLALAFAPDGQTLASAGLDGTLRLWRLPDGRPERTITVIEADGLSATAVLGTTFVDAGAAVVGTAYNGEARRFRASDAEPLAMLQTGAGGWLIAVAPGPTGLLAALDDAGRLWAWDAEGEPFGRGALADATAITTLADGRLLTVGRAGGLHLWTVGPEGPEVLALAISIGDSIGAQATGRVVAVGSRLGFVEVWDAGERVSGKRP